MEKFDKYGYDLREENLEIVSRMFPQTVKDGKIDTQLLQEILTDSFDNENEKFGFTWVGKKDSIKLSQEPSCGTLLPLKNKSKNWDSTRNVFIEGDNLEVLKTLAKTYHGNNGFDFIYIDPPYNTGDDFVYCDSYQDNIENYLKMIKAECKTNPESGGRFHTKWLNLMYPRLKLAKTMLKERGVIFISIGDEEYGNLRLICDEVFGSYNYAATFLWTKTMTPPSLSNKCRKTVEYVICYENNISNYKYFGSALGNGDAPLLNSGNPVKTLVFPKGKLQFLFKENGIIKAGKYDKVTVEQDIVIKDGLNDDDAVISGEFKWAQDTLLDEVAHGTYFIAKTEKLSIRFQRVENDGYKTPNNYLNIELNKELGIGTNETASKELEDLGMGGLFSYNKPVSLIKYLINMICKDKPDAKILDFFAGSATTAEAVMRLNAEDGGRRQFVVVQLPENLDENLRTAKGNEKAMLENMIAFCDELNEEHYLTVIGEERTRRAGEKIKAELEQEKEDAGLFSDDVTSSDSIDVGFKIFKLESTNIIPWDGSIVYDENSLLTLSKIIKDDRSDFDVAYEIMLKYGVFDGVLIEKDINGKTIFSINDDSMIIMLSDVISLDDITEIIKLKPSVVVFKESGFENDNVKMNAEYTLQHYLGENDIKVLCI